MRKAVFFDRDGVLNQALLSDQGKPLAPWNLLDFKLESSAKKAVARVKQAGFLAIVITNQPDVRAGKVTLAEIEQMHEILRAELSVDDIEVCYDTRADNSPRMKPAPGMLFDAAKKWNMDLTQSIMIGDRSGDIAAGHAAGCKTTILIDRNYLEPSLCEPTYSVDTLKEAVQIVLQLPINHHATPIRHHPFLPTGALHRKNSAEHSQPRD